MTTLVQAWAEAVSDHTGTSPIPLRLEEGDEDEWEDEDAPEPVNGDTISVVERWDLVVTNVDALLQAGREAHLRTWENETVDDAVVAVTAPAFALYTLGHEAGPPWLDLPGTELLAGTRLFVRSEGPAPEPVESDEEVVEVSQPPGDVLFAETWA